MMFFLNGTYNGCYKMCAVKVRNAKLRNYLNGPLQYNKLPIRVKEATTLSSFKTLIWNYLRN